MRLLFFLLLLGSLCASQTSAANHQNKQNPKTQSRPAKAVTARAPQSAKTFAIETVRAAVALPQSDPQDRLRVLAAAIEVARGTDPRFSRVLAREGVRIETELVGTGQRPSASVLAYADCGTAAEFAQRIYPANILAAEQSLLNALSRCPKETQEVIRSRVDTALRQGIAPPRLVMGTIENAGAGTAWANDTFARLFDALPSNVKERSKDAPDFASVYEYAAPKMAKDIARDAGIKLLNWIAKTDAGPEQNQAVNVTVEGMRQALGEQGLQEALERDVVARQIASNAGEAGGVSEDEDEESASSQEAATRLGSDQTEYLDSLPNSQRAREAAALGFAAGTGSKDAKAAADPYFDIAFAAADEVWGQRNEKGRASRAPEIINEVCEAAAHVDAISALKRAQALQDTTAQAIGMVAVARVVSNK